MSSRFDSLTTQANSMPQPIRPTDGRARQVARSWQRVLDPKVHGGRGWPLYPIATAKEFADGKVAAFTGVVASNDSTIVVT